MVVHIWKEDRLSTILKIFRTTRINGRAFFSFFDSIQRYTSVRIKTNNKNRRKLKNRATNEKFWNFDIHHIFRIRRGNKKKSAYYSTLTWRTYANESEHKEQFFFFPIIFIFSIIKMIDIHTQFSNIT